MPLQEYYPHLESRCLEESNKSTPVSICFHLAMRRSPKQVVCLIFSAFLCNELPPGMNLWMDDCKNSGPLSNLKAIEFQLNLVVVTAHRLSTHSSDMPANARFFDPTCPFGDGTFSQLGPSQLCPPCPNSPKCVPWGTFCPNSVQSWD